ncbi:hypothetical protein O181_078005 [Austropuccinia psidii MF-1]|uniref:Reverse transcriptase domain-containing protein n=1 Tax=Austropuccinia psidii MF-1 TaxID=1389203 RepID=A0A9Q3FBX1_9BASI|nr:hypothetical protein [Austropuccinia psidii MF-1]
MIQRGEIVRYSNRWKQLSSNPQIKRIKEHHSKNKEVRKEEAPVASTTKPQANQIPQEGKKNQKKNLRKPYSPSYRITNIQNDFMDNIFNMARTLMEFKDKETTSFSKEITLSPDVVNTLTEIQKKSDNSLTGFLRQVDILNALYLEMSQKMVHMKILKNCGDGKTLDIKNPKKLFIKKDKPREPFKTNKHNTYEQEKCHKCGGVGYLANNFLKQGKINGIVETEYHNDKDKESDSEKTEELETSESDEIRLINEKIHNIDLIYEVLDVNPNLPQFGTSDTSLTKIKDAKMYRIKPEKGIGYTAGKSSICIVMVENQEEKVSLDTGAYCTCVGKGPLKSIGPDWEEKCIPIQGVKFSSASEKMKPLGIIDFKLIFPPPSLCIIVKVEFLVMENCTSHHFLLGNDDLSIYGMDISSQKEKYFTMGENKRQKFGFLNNKKQSTVIKNEGKSPEKDCYIRDQLKEAESNQELTENMKEKLIDLLFKYKNSFSTDKEPLGSIIGNEVDIILNVDKPYPPLSRKPAYPASPRAREALEVNIKELIDLGVLSRVGHTEQVEVTTPVIITWNKRKPTIVGDVRALNTYTIPDRYPIHRIHEPFTQLSQSEFITAMDASKGFHQNILKENSKRLKRIIVHCGKYEYLRMPFGIENSPSNYQRSITTVNL